MLYSSTLPFESPKPRTMVYFFGTALYVGLLLTNAIAILSEERFLAKSTSPVRSRLRTNFSRLTNLRLLCSINTPLAPLHTSHQLSARSFGFHPPAVGWSTLSYTQAQQSANAGFGQDPYSLQSSDEAATQQGIKQRLIALIGAVRTLMRSESCLHLLRCGVRGLIQYG